MFRKIKTLYSDSHVKLINTFYEYNAETVASQKMDNITITVP
jgi:hypothetical protein